VWRVAGVFALATGLTACGGDEVLSSLTVPTFAWGVPQGFPVPRVPQDNPMSEAKVELGRHLFYDTRLSENETQSCASCHQQASAFTDGKPVGIGSTGQPHPRNSMSLANVGYQPVLNWANPATTLLEGQARVPIFGEDPVELGMSGREELLLERLRSEPRYQALFPAAFPEAESDAVTITNVTRALAAFERTLISANSPYDRYARGDANAISEEAKRGQDLFFSERLECFHCHLGTFFSSASDWQGKASPEVDYMNTGLYNIGGTGAYPENNRGLMDATQKLQDMGRFKAPTLRNIELTAPYFHDGSAATLDDVIDHYAAGGRTITSGPNAGVGSASPYKNSFVQGFELAPAERAALIAYLRSLTDQEFVTNPKFSDPWLSAGGE
jgi:cytochrome c peroxidase